MRWRIGSSSRSKRRRCSSLARNLAVKSSYSLRFAASAASRSSLTFNAACRPDCAVASDKRARSSCTSFSSCAIEADCCCAVSMMRLSSASRVDRLLLAKSASWTWRSSSRWRSRVALKLCCVWMTVSSNWAWRSCESANCMSSASKSSWACALRLLSSNNCASTSPKSWPI